jgi:hypothetical protein
MKILDADMLMNSSRIYREENEQRQSLRVWVGSGSAAGSPPADRVTITAGARSMLQESGCGTGEEDLPAGIEQEISLRKLIAELLSGREIRLFRIEKAGKQGTETGNKNVRQVDEQRHGWGLEYDFEQTHREREEVGFRAQGTILTADGQELVFSLELDMSREYIEKNRLSIRAGDALIDPLVINFDGNAADLTSLKFEFDLDADGLSEEIPIPTSGRGFLAVDLNNDGMINNGSELFGPTTGNGFDELASYDADGNAWIDENDEIFHRLRIMTVDSQGAQSLSTLDDHGIGAVYLDRASTLFDVRMGSTNQLLGRILATGVYLKDDGTAGTIQQLDLVA